MSKVICICPTHRDHRELAALASGHTSLHHDYASALEDLSVDECPSNVSVSDPEQEIETILRRCRAEHIQGVITTDDYPGTTVASVVAHELNLPSPKPEANLFCQHKFYSRQIQALAAPEATPDFQLIDVRPEAAMPPGRSFPLFVKPVKSFSRSAHNRWKVEVTWRKSRIGGHVRLHFFTRLKFSSTNTRGTSWEPITFLAKACCKVFRPPSTATSAPVKCM
jgi:hypothetical protein